MNGERFNSCIISMTDEGVFGRKIQDIGIPVYCLNINRKNPFSWVIALGKYLKIIRNFNPDVIQSWMYHANVFSVLFKIFFPKKNYVMNIRSSLDNFNDIKLSGRAVIYLNSFLSSSADVIIGNSRASQLQHQKIGFDKKKYTYIPNGFDIELFKPNQILKKQFHEKYAISAETKIIGLFASFRPEKNHAEFLKVARELILAGKDVFFVLGGVNCDYENKELVEIIEFYHLTDKTILLGSVDVSLFMPCVDLHLMTSRREGFPNVLGEAMACGVPCVATDVGDCKAILGEYGRVVPFGDTNGLVKACILGFGESDSRKFAMRERIEKDFSIESITRQYEKLYLFTQNRVAENICVE